MEKCPKNKKTLFKFFKVSDKHCFIFTNAFSTLDSPSQIEVVKTCLCCNYKQVVEMELNLLIEVVKKYPNAFSSTLKSYLNSWGQE
jgi:hypothetical protein